MFDFELVPERLVDIAEGIWFELQRLNRNMELLRRAEIKMSQATDNLAAAVARETTVVGSVTTLISGLAKQISESSADPRIQDLANQINANSDTLAASVAQNTVASSESPVPAVDPASTSTAPATSEQPSASAPASSEPGAIPISAPADAGPQQG